jgi:hypothetical protein
MTYLSQENSKLKLLLASQRRQTISSLFPNVRSMSLQQQRRHKEMNKSHEGEEKEQSVLTVTQSNTKPLLNIYRELNELNNVRYLLSEVNYFYKKLQKCCPLSKSLFFLKKFRLCQTKPPFKKMYDLLRENT